MKPAELRRRLRQREKALRALLAERRKTSRERLAANPAVRRERERRRRRRLLSLLVLLLLVLVSRCECQEPLPPPPPPAPAPAPPPPPPPKEVKPTRAAKPPIRKRVQKKERGGFEAEARRSPAWLDDFRLQVAARSPRLARCFDGSERPGALRWTSSVNAASGAVSDHELEPQGAGADLSREQRECVIGVLSSPAYRLGASGESALPERVSIAVEF